MDHVLKDTTIMKRQLDLAARMMLEQVSLLSNGDYKQSTMFQVSIGLRAAESTSAFVSIRERPMHDEQSMAIQLFLDCICFVPRAARAFQ